MKNPKFKNFMITKKLLNACLRQVDKYFGDRKMDETCDICEAVEEVDDGTPNCLHCPLGDGISEFIVNECPCAVHRTFIPLFRRGTASESLLLARGKYLIKQFDENGIVIYEEKAK